MSTLQQLPFLILAMGIAFDALSFLAFVATALRRRWSSGFPFIGAACYALFMILYLVPSVRSKCTVPQVLSFGATLAVLHAAMHWAHWRFRRSLAKMTKRDFYRNKTIVAIEWWLDDSRLPSVNWARLRVFDDGSADACWEFGEKLYGFESREFASYFFCEDGYRRWKDYEKKEVLECNILLSTLVPPNWDTPRWKKRLLQPFEYLGTY